MATTRFVEIEIPGLLQIGEEAAQLRQARFHHLATASDHDM